MEGATHFIRAISVKPEFKDLSKQTAARNSMPIMIDGLQDILSFTENTIFHHTVAIFHIKPKS